MEPLGAPRVRYRPRIGGVLVGIGGVLAVVGSRQPWVRLRLTYHYLSPGYGYGGYGLPGAQRKQETLASLSRSISTRGFLLLLLIAGASAAVMIVAGVRTRTVRRVGAAAMALGVGLAALVWEAFVHARTAEARVAASYRPSFPSAEGWIGMGGLTVALAALLVLIGGSILLRSRAGLATPEGMKPLPWGEGIVIGCIALSGVVLGLAIGSRARVDPALVTPFQTAAAEERLLLAMNEAQGGCVFGRDCSILDAAWMDANQDHTHFTPMRFVDGNVASSATNGYSISVAAIPVGAESPGEQYGRVGLALMAGSGICVEMVGLDPFEARYGVASSPATCTGADALRSARATQQVCGGWTVLRSESEFWPVVAQGAGTLSIYGRDSGPPEACTDQA